MFRHRWYMVGLLATLYVLSYIDRVTISLMVEPLKSDFHLSDTQMGLLMGPSFAFIFALAALPVAWLVDRGNRKRYLVLGVALWSICTTLSGFATSFPMLFGLRMGLAVGEAVLSPVALSMIGDLFKPNERATPSAVFLSSAPVGIVLAYVIGGAVIQLASQTWLAGALGLAPLASWRLSLVLVGLPGLLLATIIVFTTREPPRTHASPAPDKALQDPERFGIFASLRESFHFYVPAVSGPALLYAVSNGAVAWYPTHLIRTQGVSASAAGYIFSTALVMTAVLILSVPVLAERIARVGRRDLLLFIPLVLIPIGLGCFILALLQSSILFASIFMAVGFSIISSVGAFPQVALPVIAPPAFRGRLMAVMAFANNVIGLGLGVFLVGFLADTVFSGPGSLGSSLLAIVCAVGPVAWLLFFLAWKPYHAATSRQTSTAAT
ncbi:MFS transporter [Sphingobium sp. AN558]|uniref:MFS transporter n=1 Tax=Sphingobium sp. AN558 TaxID=3133442 RepID=UPI0030C4BDEF